MENKREFKRIRFKTNDFNEEEGIFSGYGAVFGNIDSGGDIIEPGAFTKTLAEGWERVKILALPVPPSRLPTSVKTRPPVPLMPLADLK